MVQITDKEVYNTLKLSYDRTPFREYFYRGILRLKDKTAQTDLARPYYIVEISQQYEGAPLVAVYYARPEVDAKGQPVVDEKGNWSAYKNYREKVVYEGKEKPYSDKTMLSRLANNYFGAKNKNRKKHRVRIYDKPLYVVELEEGVNTFTKKEGLGFYEYETEMVGNVSHKVKPTGVFIGLDSIKDWSAPMIRPKDLYNHIKQDEQKNESNYIEIPW